IGRTGLRRQSAQLHHRCRRPGAAGENARFLMSFGDITPAPLRFSPDAAGPLSGVRALDLSRLVAGNMLSLQLADFGADVIKVEPPSGDPLRDWRDGDRQLHWKTYARNKRSVVLNLRQPAARDALVRMVATADVF